MRYLYSIGISVYYLAAAAAGLVNSKARLFVSGRRKLFKTLAGRLEGREDRETVWFHCSSVGEFEQARPLIERLRKESPDKFIKVNGFNNITFCDFISPTETNPENLLENGGKP